MTTDNTNVISSPRNEETERVPRSESSLRAQPSIITSRSNWRAMAPIAAALRCRALRKGGDDVGS